MIFVASYSMSMDSENPEVSGGGVRYDAVPDKYLLHVIGRKITLVAKNRPIPWKRMEFWAELNLGTRFQICPIIVRFL
jgi:hypothetical protein